MVVDPSEIALNVTSVDALSSLAVPKQARSAPRRRSPARPQQVLPITDLIRDTSASY